MLPGQSAGERFKFYGFYKRQRLQDAPLGQRKGGVFRLPPPFLWTPPTPQRIKGCSPLIIPKQKSKRKNASRFAKTGCGTLRLLRALGGTRILQAAAPTAPPCIRRWRRSSPLHFFLASPIDRPLSRCGGSSPRGEPGAPSPSPSVTPCPLFVAARHLPPTGGSLSKGEARSVPSTVLALPSGELARSA